MIYWVLSVFSLIVPLENSLKAVMWLNHKTALICVSLLREWYSSLPDGMPWNHCFLYLMYLRANQVSVQSVQLLSHVYLFETPRNAACQAFLSITNSWSLLKLMSIKSVMLSNHLILCRPLLLLPPIFPSIRGFSSESVLRIRWPKYWSFSFKVLKW